MENLKILIVDDVMFMRKVIRDILVEHCDMAPGRILDAVDGADALFMYKQCSPDIVFLDIAMPDSDGAAIVKELIKIDPAAKIIMCTGSGDKVSVVECIRAGAKDYVKKPPTPERVKKALEKVMETTNE